jgi:Hg(II)-responsive transcriptional regulator
MNEMFQIGKAAHNAGVNIQTIRYYERRGLLKPQAYRESGYRLFGSDAIKRIQFIKHAQALGFTLQEIDGLLRLRISRQGHCRDVKRKAQKKLFDVSQKMKKLRDIKNTLEELIRACNHRKITDPCPILKSLDVPEVGGRKA